MSMGAVIEVPQPSTGPTARFALNDPTTQAAVGGVLLAVVTTAWKAAGHSGLSDAVQVDLNSVVGVFAVAAVTVKHWLSGRLAARVAGDVGTVAKVVEQVDPQAVAAVSAAVEPVVKAVEAEPALAPVVQAVTEAVQPVVEAVEAAPAPVIDPAVLKLAQGLVAAGLVPSLPAPLIGEPVSNIGS